MIWQVVLWASPFLHNQRVRSSEALVPLLFHRRPASISELFLFLCLSSSFDLPLLPFFMSMHFYHPLHPFFNHAGSLFYCFTFLLPRSCSRQLLNQDAIRFVEVLSDDSSFGLSGNSPRGGSLLTSYSVLFFFCTLFPELQSTFQMLCSTKCALLHGPVPTGTHRAPSTRCKSTSSPVKLRKATAP